ncbi:LysR family transcriptional regulator [Novosphingobium sp. KCTC 2891]|uniref:LysR family transcriptional regulator n=1 Tax=Novosphingobium sp. KCTC 2891 TaxID=2989730 RepID=UPI002222490F|nr:LysR family transcriptional regulator [Novosphingobium sp. KCTC 2891]MCW1382433.1 LysR family transcriptional regulator [Novosphingobium sp. KCTC 2891]
MDRLLLRYFLAVVDTGSFSRAGDLTRVSQPTVSAGIARLEREVGAPLFVRSNRRVELTEAGARLVEPARRIEAAFLEAQAALGESDAVTTIRIGIAATLASALVEAIVTACRALPGLRIELVERRAGELAALLDRGRVDCTLGPVEHAGARRMVPLFTEPYLLAMAQGHRLAGEATIAAEALVDEPMLVRRQCEALPLVSQFFTARGVRPFMAARSMSEERVAAYVRSGLGITVLPESLGAPGIALRPLAGFGLARTVGLVVEPGDHGRLARTGVVEAIRAVASPSG